jgi:hypothetical protein
MPARTPAALDELAEIAAENPGHRIWRETTYDGIRYIAQRLHLGSHPHTLVTKSLPSCAPRSTRASRSALTTQRSGKSALLRRDLMRTHGHPCPLGSAADAGGSPVVTLPTVRNVPERPGGQHQLSTLSGTDGSNPA